MKNFLRAVFFCSALLVALSGFLWQSAEAAKEDVVVRMLALPAPPPPNPAVKIAGQGEAKYDRGKPPADNAPTSELLEYWMQMSASHSANQYSPEPSNAVLARLKKEVDKNPEKLLSLLNAFIQDDDGPAFVKGHYDREGTTGVYDRDDRSTIRSWLVSNSSYFTSELAREAEQVADTPDAYVSNQEPLLALTRHDFGKAKPILNRLYADDSSPVSQTLASWALYRNALKTNSLGDIERYRDELKAIVENKELGAGMRDLAMDALVVEKEWPGRDDWYYSLLTDETLVKMDRFTGMTTLINLSPPDKYIEKMIELLKSDNPIVRGAAIRNLSRKFDAENIELIRALLPWLEDPKWAVDVDGTRAKVVEALASVAMPEAVPGLINLLDEKTKRTVPRYGSNAVMNTNTYVSNAPKEESFMERITTANRVANAAATVANVVNAAVNAARSVRYVEEEVSLQMPAVRALTKQKDPRAIAGLRRALSEVDGYERNEVIGALLASGGFSVGEQMDALEAKAKGVREESEGASVYYANSTASGAKMPSNMIVAPPPPLPSRHYANAANVVVTRPITPVEIKTVLGDRLVMSDEISDALARALVDRIEILDRSNTPLSAAFRQMILKWQNSVINSLLIRDIKNDKSTVEATIRILAQRKELREKQSGELADLANGSDAAKGLVPCMFEDDAGYTALLETGPARTKTSMLACARMLRAKLDVEKVAENLNSTDKLLLTAAERYLESEDSPKARSIVLSRYPNEAKILGARTAFFVDGVATEDGHEQLSQLYQSLGDNTLYYGWGTSDDTHLKKIENDLQQEVKKDATLLGVYAYDLHYVRIYADRVVFSWDEDESRYRERQLRKEEFNELKAYIADTRADELPPFIGCGGEYCTSKELVMLGKAGGRRVYASGDGQDFFVELEKIFKTFKETPAAVKYALSREIPGLELILADDNKFVETVWKADGSLVVAVSGKTVLERAGRQIEEEGLEASESLENEESKAAYDVKRAQLLEMLRGSSTAWHHVAEGTLGESVVQPSGVEFIRPANSLSIPPVENQWKARAGTIEIRTSEEGLFKIVGGKATRIATGSYFSPLMSQDARWVVAGSQSGNGYSLVRIDLNTGKSQPIPISDYKTPTPLAFIPSIRKFLVQIAYGSEDHYDGSEPPEENVEGDASPNSLFLLDPATGAMQQAPGEFRPLAQTTFRSLQPKSKPNEYWAAMVRDKGETSVGLYDARDFTFKEVLKLPKIAFNSMKMYVDEPANKVYFVYRGHLLAVPLKRSSVR